MSELKIKLQKSTAKIHPNDEPNQKLMKKMVFAIEKILDEGYADQSSHFDKIHPRTLISLITVNILINLFGGAVNFEDSTIQERLTMAEDLINEVKKMFLETVQTVEVHDSKVKGALH